MKHSKFNTQNSEFKIQNSEFKIQNSKLAPLLLALLLFGACQPTDRERQRDITYTVANEQPATVHLASEAEFQTLLSNFCDWAEAGSEVTFWNGTQASSLRATKEATECSTTSREEIKRWMAQMEDAGLTVTVTYDPATGTWHGTAYALPPQPQPSGRVATYVSPGLDIIVTIDSANRTVYVNHNVSYLHMPFGIFENVYEENGRLILDTSEDTLAYGSYTFYIRHFGGDTLLIDYIYRGACTADHIHHGFLVPATQHFPIWVCREPYDIVMHIFPSVAEVYPELYMAKVCAPLAEHINCIAPIHTGVCELWRSSTSRPGLDWELSLHYQGHDGTTQYISDSLGITNFLGHNSSTDCMVIHDLHRNPGCASCYVFAQVN